MSMKMCNGYENKFEFIHKQIRKNKGACVQYTEMQSILPVIGGGQMD